MTFKNTSRYPDAEVRRLVEFALRNLDHRGVAVHVKNCSGAFAGRAYYGVPHESPLSRRRKRRIRRLMTVRIGAPEKFPVTTRYPRRKSDDGWPLIEYRDWREALVGIAAHEAHHIRQFDLKTPRSEMECERVAKKRVEEYRRECGTCEFCGETSVRLIARLVGDPDQRVCSLCHADPRIPTTA